MKIIIKEREDGVRCLFDNRSNQFLRGGCIRTDGEDLLEIANALVRRNAKTIVDIADFPVYGDNGYVESMIARSYLELNPDLLEKAKENKEKSKERVDRKTQFKGKRGRKPKENKVEKPKVLGPDGQPRKRGRPKKVVQEGA